MPLKLVIGPANAEKAGAAMDAYRTALAAGREPLLVVPTFADVDVYRRELAASGAVFGVQVVQFQRLMGEIGRRTRTDGRPVGGLARERVAAVATTRTKLDTLAASAATPGFARSLLGLIGELEELRLDPPRVIRALRAWTADDPSRRPYADELGTLYAAYRRELDRAQALDHPLQDGAALDALRLDPSAWRRTPVVIYGFDDLSPLQRDAVETLACHAEADVTLTLPYEPGRTALAARARTYEDLRALPGAEVLELRAVADHYASPALHHLERTLFEPGEGLALFDAASVPAGDAVRMLEGGGERAEVELVAAEVAGLLRGGHPPEEIAVVWRSREDIPLAAEEVFAAYGVPVALTRRLRARDTALGRGVIALLRCALLEGTADDLLAWLRTPGVVDTPGLADRLEADVRRTGIGTAARARALWEERHWPLQAIDFVAEAHARGPAALCDRLAREVNRLFSRPHRLEAPILDGTERVDANAAAALRSALRELGRLARRDPELVPPPAELERVLGDLPVFAGRQAGPGLVQVTHAEAIRARRVRSLFLCGLNEHVFPAAARPDPLLSDQDRVAINQAAGLRLTVGVDQLALERYLLYAAVSRPTELLVLSWHAATDDGDPVVRSLFVDDVADRFSDDPLSRRRRRALGAAGWPAGEAPTPREAALAAAAAAPPAAPRPLGPVSPEVMAQAVPADRPLSATAIEAFNDCPVKWFVDRLLRPKDLVPDPEAMVRGSVAHEVLAAVFAEGGGRPLCPADLPAARERMHAALAESTAKRPISVNPERVRAEVRRLESDLVRYLENAAHDGSELGPVAFEHEFTADLGTFELSGRIDRIDAGGGEAVLLDYKGKSATPQARWLDEGRLQLGLYVLAARRLAEQGDFPGEPVGGLYQPLGNAKESRPRGALLEDADPGRNAFATDRLSAEAFEKLLSEVLAAAQEAVAQLRAGALEPRPRTCAWGGGCEHPTICRGEAS